MWERCSTSIQDVGGLSKSGEKPTRGLAGGRGLCVSRGCLQPKLGSWAASGIEVKRSNARPLLLGMKQERKDQNEEEWAGCTVGKCL